MASIKAGETLSNATGSLSKFAHGVEVFAQGGKHRADRLISHAEPFQSQIDLLMAYTQNNALHTTLPHSKAIAIKANLQNPIYISTTSKISKISVHKNRQPATHP